MRPDPWLRPDAGTPLGHGYPSGPTLREDGETHRQAWQRIIRLDPCSYCDRPAPAGTVDHIAPRHARDRTTETWQNYTAACAACNGSKGGKPLLLFLARRGVLRKLAL